MGRNIKNSSSIPNMETKSTYNHAKAETCGTNKKTLQTCISSWKLVPDEPRTDIHVMCMAAETEKKYHLMSKICL